MSTTPKDERTKIEHKVSHVGIDRGDLNNNELSYTIYELSLIETKHIDSPGNMAPIT